MSKHFSFLTAATLVVAGAVGCASPRAAASAPMQAGGAEGMEAWSQNHPDASYELGAWVKRHPEAARLFFEWDGRHHDQAQRFVIWTIRHSRQDVDAFALEHTDRWDDLDRILQDHRSAAGEFMTWCRERPKAAEALMNHPNGLEWAGHHLYQDAWMMKHG